MDLLHWKWQENHFPHWHHQYQQWKLCHLLWLAPAGSVQVHFLFEPEVVLLSNLMQSAPLSPQYQYEGMTGILYFHSGKGEYGRMAISIHKNISTD
jgi:hypothetical protein